MFPEFNLHLQKLISVEAVMHKKWVIGLFIRKGIFYKQFLPLRDFRGQIYIGIETNDADIICWLNNKPFINI